MINPLLSGSALLTDSSFQPIKPSIRNRSNGLNASHSKNFSVHQRDSFELFNNILKKAYKRIAENSIPNAANQQANLSSRPITNYANPALPAEKLTSQQASSNILNFISGRLRSDAAKGATQEELLNKLDQGLQGFIRGFNEAKDQIEALGLLTPALGEEIDDTYAKVTSGIEELRQTIKDKFGAGDQTIDLPIANRIGVVGESVQKASFSLSLTTQDGDQVSINVSKSQQFGFSATFENSGNVSKLELSQQSSTQQAFSLQVNGELDAEELSAINALLQDVDGIAKEFYNGDLDQAFALAQDLQIDRDQLSSLNLELAKSTNTKAIAAYESTAQQSTASAFKDLEQLLGKVDSLLDNATKFSHPLDLIKDLFASINQLESPDDSNDTEELSDKTNALITKFNLLSEA